MEDVMQKLRIEDNNYYVESKKRFQAYTSMINEDKTNCFNFAYNMSYGKEGAHRVNRSGGQKRRKSGEIFINTFQGKLAEYALYRYLCSKNIVVNSPDITTYNLGTWDSYDLVTQGKYISVKSTKSYRNLLLLETKDWNEKGEYIPNIATAKAHYDYTVLVRFKPDGEELMKENTLLTEDSSSIKNNFHDLLEKIVCNPKWEYDFPGFIYYYELVKMINDKRIIPQNALLNGKISMDAENYYYQTGQMHPMNEIYTYQSQEDQQMKLNRTCPQCGQLLEIKNGPHGRFWGCRGYIISGCRYHEKI